MEQLHPERPQPRPPVEEEEVAAGPRVLDGRLDEVDDGVALEPGVRAEAEVACKMSSLIE